MTRTHSNIHVSDFVAFAQNLSSEYLTQRNLGADKEGVLQGVESELIAEMGHPEPTKG